jgi:hypothetical protein
MRDPQYLLPSVPLNKLSTQLGINKFYSRSTEIARTKSETAIPQYDWLWRFVTSQFAQIHVKKVTQILRDIHN